MSNFGEIVARPDSLRVKAPSQVSLETPLHALVERAQRGDALAFDQIIICCQRKVVATAWRILGNQADALDAAQEVFLRLYRYLRTFDTEQNFSAWLYRLIMNACHDTRKRRSKELSLDSEGERATLANMRADDDVEASAIGMEDHAVIARALASLPEKERMALVLRDLEGLPTEEVARVLGSTPTTVRSQISSARSKIRLFRERFFREGGAA